VNTLVAIGNSAAVEHCYIYNNVHMRDIFYSCYSSWRQIAREGPVEGVSCGARELLEWAKKESIVGASELQFSDGRYAKVLF
jgi:hypothetical protein